jgi:selenide,water dikinase
VGSTPASPASPKDGGNRCKAPRFVLTSLAHGGGCGCKLSPAVLSEILAKTTVPRRFANLLVGTETADDAAVYRINDRQAIVATTDFFTPVVDDPFDFGRIAATNALSDIYAMGGTPILALAILGIPVEQDFHGHRAADPRGR